MRNAGFSKAMKLFEEEQNALRLGAMEKVAAIGQRKEALLADLTDIKLSHEQAIRMREQAERSTKMLSAAIQGIKDAQNRLAALEKIRNGLSVYDANGERHTVAKGDKGLHHKV